MKSFLLTFPAVCPGRSAFYINTLHIYFFILLCGGPSILRAQQFDWAWASTIHGTHSDIIQEVKPDIHGEILVVGNFYSTAIQWGDTMLINPFENNYNGLYVGKVNTQKKLLWSKSIFCNAGDDKSDVLFRSAAVNDFGESFIAGHVYRGGISINSFELDYAGYHSSGFITRFTRNGDVEWAHIFEDGCDVTSVVPDHSGGFYIMGNMYWYCDSIDFGDTTIINAIQENQAYIAHYNKDNTVDWAKLAKGYINGISGQLTEDENLLIIGSYQINGFLHTLTIDGNVITCPPDVYRCKFFSVITLEGHLQWLKNISEQEIGANCIDSRQNAFTLDISFSDSILVLQEDTIIAGTHYSTRCLATFDTDGNYLYHGDTLPFQFGNAFYNIFRSPAGNWYATFLLNSSVICNTDLLTNIAGSADPAIMQVDSNMQSLDCYQQDLTNKAFDPVLCWDRFGNIIMRGSYSGDTLVFGTDVLTNYQF
ncbi:MAG: hypothetical protein R2794_12820, partial [Chitinophagales bacterium]